MTSWISGEISSTVFFALRSGHMGEASLRIFDNVSLEVDGHVSAPSRVRSFSVWCRGRKGGRMGLFLNRGGVRSHWNAGHSPAYSPA